MGYPDILDGNSGGGGNGERICVATRDGRIRCCGRRLFSRSFIKINVDNDSMEMISGSRISDSICSL